MKKLGLIFFLSALAVSASDVYTFSLLPPNGSVLGAPGSTVGWGYALQNDSSSLWLVPTNLNAGAFADGTPALLFDFGILAPATSVAESFDLAKSSGLFELTWDASAPPGFSNAGTFTLDAEMVERRPVRGRDIRFRRTERQRWLHGNGDSDGRSGARHARIHGSGGLGLTGSGCFREGSPRKRCGSCA